jgi:hypothetical protein
MTDTTETSARRAAIAAFDNADEGISEQRLLDRMARAFARVATDNLTAMAFARGLLFAKHYLGNDDEQMFEGASRMLAIDAANEIA